VQDGLVVAIVVAAGPDSLPSPRCRLPTPARAAVETYASNEGNRRQGEATMMESAKTAERNPVEARCKPWPEREVARPDEPAAEASTYHRAAKASADGHAAEAPAHASAVKASAHASAVASAHASAVATAHASAVATAAPRASAAVDAAITLAMAIAANGIMILRTMAFLHRCEKHRSAAYRR
jgi:hypothetical protein